MERRRRQFHRRRRFRSSGATPIHRARAGSTGHGGRGETASRADREVNAAAAPQARRQRVASIRAEGTAAVRKLLRCNYKRLTPVGVDTGRVLFHKTGFIPGSDEIAWMRSCRAVYERAARCYIASRQLRNDSRTLAKSNSYACDAITSVRLISIY